MTIRITKTKFAAAIMAVVMLVPATAYATHVFDDVPDGAFYAGPVEWAFDNEITTGKTATEFAPLDGVTRGEAVTFLQRYNDNVVEPALADVNAAELEGREADEIVRAAGTRDETSVNNWNGDDETISRSMHAPTNGFLVINYVATVTMDSDETATGEAMLTADLDVDSSTVATTYGGIDFDLSWQANFNTLTINDVVAVTAGAHTVEGIVSDFGSIPGGALFYIYDQSLTVTFVPFDANGFGPV